MSVFRIREFFLCTDPDAYPGYFPVWGDYRCPRPGLDLLFFLQVGDTGSQPMRFPHFSFVVGIREFSLDPQSVDFLLSGSALFIRVGPLLFQQSKYPYALLTLLPCVIARDQGGGGGRRRQRRRRRGLRGGGGGGGGGRHPRGRRG